MATPADHYQYPSPQQARQYRSQPQYQQSPQHQHTSHSVKTRSFSFRSDKSHHSVNVKELHETSAEKESRRLHTKADPTLAINEAEPAAVAAMMTRSSYAPLRAMQHKDHWGNPIADPDKSNPTRNRWERPLDTIRSFEAAIDGGYSRKSMYRSNTEPMSNYNRRNSLMPTSQPRMPQDSYYGGPPQSFRGDSSYGPPTPMTMRSSYFEMQPSAGYNPAHGPPPGRPWPRDRPPRMHSQSPYQVYGREQEVYPMPHKDRSYETVTSATPSGNSDPAGYQTDPTSSDNSSIDRTSSAKRREPANDYGIGFSQPPNYQTPNFSVGMGASSNSHPLPPPPPPAAEPIPHHPGSSCPVNHASVLKRQPSQARPGAADKRKSWFSRRFGKNA